MKWDEDLYNFKVTEKIDEEVDIIKYEMQILPPNVTRSYYELRSFKYISLSNQKAYYIIYTTSIELPSQNTNDITATTLRNCYIIEANDNKSKVFRLYRGDYR